MGTLYSVHCTRTACYLYNANSHTLKLINWAIVILFMIIEYDYSMSKYIYVSK